MTKYLLEYNIFYMNPLNHDFYHLCKTGTTIKISVIRDGVNTPKFIPFDNIKDLNTFELEEYSCLLVYITDLLLDHYTDSEYNSLLTEGENQMKKYKDNYGGDF